MSSSAEPGILARCELGVLVIVVVAWVAGLVAYLAAGGLLYGQRISPGDLHAASLFSAAAVVLSCVVYLPALSLLRRLLRDTECSWPFAAVAASLAPRPVMLVFSAVGSPSWRAMRSPEAMLFYVFFGVFGLVLGTGYARLHRSWSDRS